MSYSKDWVPEGLPEFKIFADTFCAEVANNKTPWNMHSDDARTIALEHKTFNDH